MAEKFFYAPSGKLQRFLRLCRFFLICSIVVGILAVGWKLRQYNLISPKYGIGYILGIEGFACLLVLMLYPLRKRLSFLSFLGIVKTWFKNHMALGIIGPLCVLFHCNFSLGALNSNVALFSMLVVTLSGIFGRFIYARIHFGLYGQRATVEDLKQKIKNQKDEIYSLVEAYPQIKVTIIDFIDALVNQKPTVFNHCLNVVVIRWKVFFLYGRILRLAQKGQTPEAKEQSKRLLKEIRKVLRNIIQLAEYAFYDKAFSIWHLLHIPLVWVMFLTIIIHVIAVHLY